MKSFQGKAHFLTVVGLGHLITTGIINLIAAGWYMSKYEHSVMQGQDVTLPLALVVLDYAGKGLMSPLVPLIYS